MARTCSVETCEKPSRQRGWCHMHYIRWWKHGDPLYERPSAGHRFWSRVDKDGPVPSNRPDLGPCWVWTGGKVPDGYGSFYTGGHSRNIGAHRFAYELCVGEI